MVIHLTFLYAKVIMIVVAIEQITTLSLQLGSHTSRTESEFFKIC